MVKTILFSITIILVWVALCPAFVSSPSNPMVTQVIPAGSVIRTPIGQIILVRVDSLLVEPEYPRAPIIVPEPRRPEYPRPEPPPSSTSTDASASTGVAASA